MTTGPELVSGLIEACRAAIAAHADHLCELDRAIGDGDHGTNMRRGCEAVHNERESVSALPFPEALERIGTVLVFSVGGAAGPLYGTLLIEMGRRLGARGDTADFPAALKEAVEAVARRGRAKAGDKTLLDVLYPVQDGVEKHASPADIAERAALSARSTTAMLARRGRAAFLGDRSIGHMDPGASSCALLTGAICGVLGAHASP